MAMVTGTTAATSGLAGELFTALEAQFGATPAGIDADRRLFCFTIADTIIKHVIANAQLTITPLHPGLQTGATAGSPTGSPVAPAAALAPVIS